VGSAEVAVAAAREGAVDGECGERGVGVLEEREGRWEEQRACAVGAGGGRDGYGEKGGHDVGE